MDITLLLKGSEELQATARTKLFDIDDLILHDRRQTLKQLCDGFDVNGWISSLGDLQRPPFLFTSCLELLFERFFVCESTKKKERKKERAATTNRSEEEDVLLKTLRGESQRDEELGKTECGLWILCGL